MITRQYYQHVSGTVPYNARWAVYFDDLAMPGPVLLVDLPKIIQAYPGKPSKQAVREWLTNDLAYVDQSNSPRHIFAITTEVPGPYVRLATTYKKHLREALKVSFLPDDTDKAQQRGAT